MAHLTTTGEHSRFRKTDPAWLETGSQLAGMANTWSDRDDIIAFVGDGAGAGVSVACFTPSTAEMDIDVKQAFGETITPGLVPDLSLRANQFDYPAVMGAVLHEASHAAHSKFSLPDLAKEATRLEHSVTTSLEESRIERLILRDYPENTSFLRATAMEFVMDGVDETKEEFAAKGHAQMSQIMLLALARVDAGSLEEEDVTAIREAAVDTYGEDMLQKLRDIWLRAQAHRDDYDYGPLLELAREWIALFEDEGHELEDENPPEDLMKALQDMLGDSGTGEDGGLGDMADDTAVAAGGDAAEQAGKEQAEAEAAARAAAGKESTKAKSEADKVFGKGTGPGFGSTGSRLVSDRPPTGKERAAAVALAQALEKARYHDRIAIKRTSQVPAGRLVTRSAVAAAAERKRGAVVTAKPWKSTKRLHSEDPTLTVGLLVDISGSMSGAMNSMGTASWVVPEAVRRIQGDVATVYYGNSVFAGQAPGQHSKTVKTYSAPDYTEVFNSAFKALDGKLRLLQGSGARIVFVISDLHYTADELEAFRHWSRRMRESGVALVVAAPDTYSIDDVQRRTREYGTAVLPDWRDPVAMANIVGAAAVKELQKAGA